MSLFCRWFPWLCQAPVVLPLPTPVVVPTLTGNPSSAAPEFVALLNAERSNFGLPGMKTDAGLTSIAQEWATEQANLDFMSHGDFYRRISSVHPNVWAAENVAEGYADIRSTVIQWMESPPHRKNMLGNYDWCGIGHAVSALGNHYWCADFAKLG